MMNVLLVLYHLPSQLQVFCNLYYVLLMIPTVSLPLAISFVPHMAYNKPFEFGV